MHLAEIKKDLHKLASPKKAKILARFFKTGAGEYGEGDIFLGVTVPRARTVAQKHKDLSLKDAENLLKSKIHEERLTAILLLVHNYQTGDVRKKKEIVEFYLKNTARINNWDLVDLSADKILGAYLLDNKSERGVLYGLAKSKNIWERRIAIISTFNLIKNRYFEDTLNISEILLGDGHDLMHKAVGWMLREVGKRNLRAEEGFLKKHVRRMPRTTLRYAIERFPEDKRLKYLNF
ncbi:MAG TPA: DNA alkylation repair protein [Candidatus Paceibacterota bacterium]